MFAGVGIIGALASILASILVPSPKTDGPDPDSRPAWTTSWPAWGRSWLPFAELLSGANAKPPLDDGEVTAPTT